MTGIFTSARRQQYERDGFVFPINLFGPAELDRYKQAFEQSARSLVAAGAKPPHKQCHLCFRWAYDLATDPRILDMVEELIGPNILVFNSTVFAKPPRNPSFVSWHQDSTYLTGGESKIVAVWLALTPTTPESGCMRVIAGSHKLGRLPHVSRPHADNLLTFGSLEVDHEIDDTHAVDVELQPGQISLHHGDTIHGSGANRSDHWRTGIVIRYAPPEVRTTAPLYRVVMARGRDTHGHYTLLEQVPPLDIASGVAGHTAYREWHDRTLGPSTSAEASEHG